MNTVSFTKTYNGSKVLTMPSFTFESSKIYAVIGANGSGKSTLARILAGTESPDSGQKITGGMNVAYLPQKCFAFRMSTKRNIMLGGSDEARAEMLMNRLSISRLSGKNAKHLSGGESARMALARVLMSPCDMLILDEPAAAMDMASSVEAEALIRDYRDETGCSVLLVTHSLQQARRIADEVLFFSEGELIEHGETAKCLSKPRSEELKSFLEFY